MYIVVSYTVYPAISVYLTFGECTVGALSKFSYEMRGKCHLHMQHTHFNLVLPPAPLWAESHPAEPLIWLAALHGSATQLGWLWAALSGSSCYWVAILGNKSPMCIPALPTASKPPRWAPTAHWHLSGMGPTISESRKATKGLSGLFRYPKWASSALWVFLILGTFVSPPLPPILPRWATSAHLGRALTSYFASTTLTISSDHWR